MCQIGMDQQKFGIPEKGRLIFENPHTEFMLLLFILCSHLNSIILFPFFFFKGMQFTLKVAWYRLQRHKSSA